MASREPEYPKAFYLPDNPNPVYAHREKDEEPLRAKGYTDRIPYFEFPKCLYHATLNDVIVQSKDEQGQYLAKGYVLAPIVKLEVEAAPDPVALQAKIDAQQELLKSLLADRDLRNQDDERHKKTRKVDAA